MHMHPHVVIQDPERNVCHLYMMHKGSISCKHLSFATLDLFLFYSPHLECPTVHKEGKTQRTGRRSRGRGTGRGDGGRAKW